jgi:butyryl-CoA dehydrogenase
MWARMAQISLPKAEEDAFYKAKLGTARFFMERMLPQTSGLFSSLMAGGGSLMDFAEEDF